MGVRATANLFAKAMMVASLLGTAFVSAKANAAPYIDPSLRPYFMGGSLSSQPVTVIALFENKLQPNGFVGSRSYSGIRNLMMRNALESQAEAVRALKMTSSFQMQAKQLWIVNAMIIRTGSASVSKLAQLPNVKALYANRPLRLIASADRGAVSPQALENMAVTYGLEKMGVDKVRATLPNLNGEGVRVGIIDTGIDAAHPDLAGRLVAWKDFAKTSTTPVDQDGHGTHVAGTIAGGSLSKTSIGVAPAAQLVVARIFAGSSGTTLDAILGAMQWMADPDGNPNTQDAPRVVNNSWGGGSPDDTQSPADDVLCKAVDNWVKAGILPVFASGNAGPGPSSVGLPGACPTALAVGATDQRDQTTSFSSRGPAVWKTGSIMKPEVAAPGNEVISSVPGGGYRAMSGTSMASPHVTGVAALIIQAGSNLTPEQVGSVLMSTALDIGARGRDNDSGTGRVDALKALRPALGIRSN